MSDQSFRTERDLLGEKAVPAAAMEHNPRKARVLLRLALLKSRSNADLQRLFTEY